MRRLKAILLLRRPKRKQPQTPYNPAKGDRTQGTWRINPVETGSGQPPDSPPPASFPDGVKVLHDCPDATVDIYFVHGLTGDRNSTWTAHGQSTPWPKTLLPSRLRNARILTYGYDAHIVRKSVAGSNRLIEHATNFLHDLTTDRASCDASSRPLIFVAHSLGGLICKEAILLSRNNPESHLQGIFDCTKGIVFMGTPHKGSWMADWAKIPASALGFVKSTNKSLLTILETDGQFLESIQVRFWSMIRELREAGRRLEVTCFFEELPLPVIGKVVSKESATLEGYSSISIHANHSDMVRFGSADDNGFERLLSELTRWESQIKDSPPSQPTRSLEEAQIDKPASSSFNSYGSGNQFNAPGGTQNNNTGSGNQFTGASLSGPVHFG
ncbi:hypothetical protein DL764_008800 [Monosporascus ibericus]|uniref:NACHT-NTPase sigma domain-containing protein n=1 Tax=Monosporascus ibericus TaxID=155417 RepID=A0A4Q4SYV0_9PEZI|nr:hypothetical protein DL764_008800 [Monosporascus ibericus]